jgi:hypothetical protein
MYDMLRRKLEPLRNYCIARLDRRDIIANRLKPFCSSSGKYCVTNSTTNFQVCVCGVYDGVNMEFSYVALYYG